MKGSSLVIIGLAILCVLSAVQIDAKPVVISASRVPVLGGTTHIYGRGFGSDASLLNVQIEDPTSESGATVACTDVEIVTSDRVIGCRVSSVGTGKSMHVTVSATAADGVVSTNDEDNNAAFSREIPSLDNLVYSVEAKTIVLNGDNFGYDATKVLVLLEGNDYPILAIDNKAITLRLLRKRREDGYEVPDSNFAFVTVDSQSNIANMTATRAALVSETPEDVTEPKKSGGGMDKGKVAGLAVGGAFAFIIVSVFVAIFVMKRNKSKDAMKQETSNNNSKKPETGRAAHETGRALNFALVGAQKEAPPPEIAYPELQMSPIMREEENYVEPEQVMVEETEEDVLERAEAGGAIVADAEDREEEEDHHSLEEIDLRDDIYEKNDLGMSDSSFSESSDDESEHEGMSSSLSAEFSDATPIHSPVGEKRQQLQMSSEFPRASIPSTRIQQSRIEQSPSPPMLISTRESHLPPSGLRNSMIPLNLDGADSDGSPLPSPRNTSPTTKQGKKKSTKKKGMIRVPSSRIVSRASIAGDTFDSPKLTRNRV